MAVLHGMHILLNVILRIPQKDSTNSPSTSQTAWLRCREPELILSLWVKRSTLLAAAARDPRGPLSTRSWMNEWMMTQGRCEGDSGRGK